jgi:hypothetical protein
MLHFKRRAIAYMVAKATDIDKEISAIYDYKESAYFNFSGTLQDQVNLYDHSRSCYITGNLSSLYDYGTNTYMNLEIDAQNFKGYDYESNTYYSGNIAGGSISFYDYEDSSYYNFSV